MGNSQLQISAIGQGTGFEFNKKNDIRNISQVLREGIKLGLNFIDTAENYAEGKSEISVGQAIKGIRQKAIIATKFSAEHSRFNDVIQSCENSLRRLGTDYIDLYQLHWPNPSVPLDETFSALIKLKKSGKVKHFGISNFAKDELENNKNILLTKAKIVSLQAEYNLFERTAEFNGTFDFCRKNNLIFIAYSPLDQGRFEEFDQKQMTLIKKLSKKYSKLPSQIILRWVIAKKFVVAIPRTSNINHLKENIDTLYFDIERDDIKLLNNAFHYRIEYIPINKIKVLSIGERNRESYQNLDEALENKYQFAPSPLELSKSLKNGSFLRPIRLIPIKNGGGHYGLVNGRVRFWAWVIAFGTKKPIPSYIRRGFK